MQYHIEYEKDGQQYIFQCQAESKLEAVEQFRDLEHHDVKITQIKEQDLC